MGSSTLGRITLPVAGSISAFGRLGGSPPRDLLSPNLLPISDFCATMPRVGVLEKLPESLAVFEPAIEDLAG